VPFDISLRQGLAYDRQALVPVLRGMIGETGGWPERIRPGARVLLKVNMLAAKSPGRGITTHPEVVAAMALLLKELGCTVAVGDSPGGAVGGIERYWRNCGYEALASDPGVELVSFEKAGSVERTAGSRVYHIARPMYDFDAVVNMCKFKTHMLCRLTNAVKNSFGAIPGLGKAVIHSQAVRPRDLASFIVDIYSLVRFDLTVMDAILSLDGRGPSTDGRSRPDGVLAVARDGVELDMVMSELVGLGAEEVETTREARRRGLGRPRGMISVCGSASFDEFDVPGNWFYNLVPGFAGTLVRWALKTVPRSNAKCTGCGFCAGGCPVGAIRIVDGRARMSRRKCIACLCCHELCPENAIVLDLPLGRK
jgi:uncharacterized protein (DUF362 family)/Pyruvate/2-oxoacid:ferredoxin oxidoreductase delta subunit